MDDITLSRLRRIKLPKSNNINDESGSNLSKVRQAEPYRMSIDTKLSSAKDTKRRALSQTFTRSANLDKVFQGAASPSNDFYVESKKRFTFAKHSRQFEAARRKRSRPDLSRDMFNIHGELVSSEDYLKTLKGYHGFKDKAEMPYLQPISPSQTRKKSPSRSPQKSGTNTSPSQTQKYPRSPLPFTQSTISPQHMDKTVLTSEADITSTTNLSQFRNRSRLGEGTQATTETISPSLLRQREKNKNAFYQQQGNSSTPLGVSFNGDDATNAHAEEDIKAMEDMFGMSRNSNNSLFTRIPEDKKQHPLKRNKRDRSTRNTVLPMLWDSNNLAGNMLNQELPPKRDELHRMKEIQSIYDSSKIDQSKVLKVKNPLIREDPSLATVGLGRMRGGDYEFVYQDASPHKVKHAATSSDKQKGPAGAPNFLNRVSEQRKKRQEEEFLKRKAEEEKKLKSPPKTPQQQREDDNYHRNLNRNMTAATEFLPKTFRIQHGLVDGMVLDFFGLIEEVVFKLKMKRTIRKWKAYIKAKQMEDYKKGLHQVSQWEGVYLFQETILRVRKELMTLGFSRWTTFTEKTRTAERIRKENAARIMIARNVLRRLRRKQEKRRKRKEKARKKRIIRQMIQNLQRSKRYWAFHKLADHVRWWLAKELRSALLIQSVARICLAKQVARIQKRRTIKAQDRYRYYMKQRRASFVLQRNYRWFLGRREHWRRIQFREEIKKEWINEMKQAKLIQIIYRKKILRRNAQKFKEQLKQEKIEYLAAYSIQKSWKCAKFRAAINKRADMRYRMETMATRNTLMRLIQDAWWKHHDYERYLERKAKERERRKKMPGAATTIKCKWRLWKHNLLLKYYKKAKDFEKRQVYKKMAKWVARQKYKRLINDSARKIQMRWMKYKGNMEAYYRMLEKQAEEEAERQRQLEHKRMLNEKATIIAKFYKASLFRYCIHVFVMRKIEEMRPKHAAACRIQRTWIWFQGNTWLRVRFQQRKKAMELARLNKNAATIQRIYKEYYNRYYAPSRLVLRRKMEIDAYEKERIEREEREAWAVRILIKWIRRRTNRMQLADRFEFQRLKAIADAQHEEEMRRAYLIQKTYRQIKWLAYMNKRCLQRKAAVKIQICWRKHAMWKILTCRFEMRKRDLAVQAELKARKDAAVKLEEEALALQAEAEDELAYKISKSWKLGADIYGRNYYYNWVTGESTWDKPEGWEPQPEELWIKNVDDKGNTYYFHQITKESRWLPPCQICYGDAQRFCIDCNMTFCDTCFIDEHDNDEMKDHEWSGADVDQESLQPGEVFCCECRKKAAKRVCKTCLDPYCEKCFDIIHRSGWLSTHEYMSWKESLSCWREVKGRTEKEPSYYLMPETGETTFIKPRELMRKEELEQYDKFLIAKEAATKYAKRIEELQNELEEKQYTIDLKWAEEMERIKEMEELKEEIEDLRKLNGSFMDALLDRLNPWRAYKKAQMKRARELLDYRSKLLESKTDRQKKGVTLGGGKLAEGETDAEKKFRERKERLKGMDGKKSP